MGSWDVRYQGSRDAAQGTKTFSFERPQALDYRPGQFFFVTLPGAPGVPKEKLTHHFSFSSSPTEPDVEFTTRMTGHPFKEHMRSLDPGSIVTISGPDGAFVLPGSMRKAAYVCGGIGITPVRSTLRWAVDTSAPVDLVVLYANADLASAPFREELDAMQSPTVRVVLVLSHPEAGWTGRSGHIDPDLVEAEIPDWGDRHFFVSGPPGMVTAVARSLQQEMGVAQDSLTAEAFPGYE